MFIHIAKDFMKKLEDIDARLSVSLDKDEIQTLGLKLRFYHNEIRHYKSLLNDIHVRIVETQQKYGFRTEDEDMPPLMETAAPQQQYQAPAPQPIPQPAEPQEPKPDRQQSLKILSDWVAQLEQQGQSPRDVLGGAAGEILRQAPPPEPEKQTAIDFSLPEEEPPAFSEPEPPAVAERQPAAEHPVAPAPEPPEQPMPLPHKEYTLDAKQQILHTVEALHVHEPTHPAPSAAPEPQPQPSSASRTQKPLDLLFEQWAVLFENNEQGAVNLAEKIRSLQFTRRQDILFGLDQMLVGKKDIPDQQYAGIVTLCWGLLAHETGRNGLAINLLQQAISRGAAYAICYLALAEACLSKNLHEKALINFKFAAKIDPSLEQARLGAAECLIHMERPGEALDFLKGETFATENSIAESAILQAGALDRLNRSAEAAAVLEDAAAKISAPVALSQIYFHLGQYGEKIKDVLKAIGLYEKALDTGPDNLPARFALGRLYLQHQAFPLAREQFNYLIRKHPDSEWADKARELL